MRKFLPIAAAALLAACSSTSDISSNVAGSHGTGMGQQPGTGYNTGPVRGGALGPLEAAKAELASIGDRVYFDTDSVSLDARAKATLDQQIAWLRRNPTIRLLVEGHADERGTREYNLALGDRRAQAVKNYMQDSGIVPSRLRTVSYGKERPVAVGSSETSWAQNRRAVSMVDG